MNVKDIETLMCNMDALWREWKKLNGYVEMVELLEKEQDSYLNCLWFFMWLKKELKTNLEKQL